MSVLKPKTIIINVPKPGKFEVQPGTIAMTTNSICKRVFDDVDDDQPRKRRRLTNLTPDEKLMRRKLKNRVAAQTARDRKKAKMDELETLYVELETQNRKLLAENAALKTQSGILSMENKQLKERLGLPLEGIVKEEKSVSPESAVLAVPLQQEQTQVLSPSMMHSMAYLMTFSVICLISLNNLMKEMKVTTIQFPSLEQHNTTKHPEKHISKMPFLQWWGPQQKSWTPSKN